MVSIKILPFLLALTFVSGQNVFRLANIYADEMVLQMEPKQAKIWGFGEPGSTIQIFLSSTISNGATDSNGKWSVILPPRAAGGPFVLDIHYRPLSGNNQQQNLTVYFGDVWICSGQSNMQMTIAETFNTTEEVNKALLYTNLRLMLVNMDYNETELDEIESIGVPWSQPTAENVPRFSALCIMFGERITNTVGFDRPIGLIATTWWGTPIEAWTSTRVHQYCNTPPGTMPNQNQDHVLWNAMIHPLIPLAVRGAIWYQGETNAGYNQDFYPCHLTSLIDDWKTSFTDGTVPVPNENNIDFPFGIVQIGPYFEGDDDQYGHVRWHQTINTGIIPNNQLPNSFMAASYDTTDPDSPTGNIHPRDKQTIADRLSNAAKTVLYNETHSLYGPKPISNEITALGEMTITYDRDIVVQNNTGFSYRLSTTGNWTRTSIIGTQGRTVSVQYDSTAVQLAYGFMAVVCDYKAATIYSNDAERLPAQIWLWNL